MAVTGFRLVGAAGNVVDSTVVDILGSATINVGDVLQLDFAAESQSLVRRPASTVGPVRLFGVAASALATGTGRIKVIPIVPGQIWEAGCASQTYLTHELKRHVLSDHDLIANTADDQSTSLGIFLMYSIKGGSACIGEFIRLPQHLVANAGQSSEYYT